MPFTGKATYSAGQTLPELAEDVSDLVSINSPHETPLLDLLGDAQHPARSTVHEWLEDSLLPNSDTLVSLTGTSMVVSDATRFRAGDQLRIDGFDELLLVNAVNIANNTLSVVRGYGGTDESEPSAGAIVHILGNAALEGGDASTARFTVRQRRSNFTQIFSSTIEISGSELAVRQLGVRDEMEWQKLQRTRELLRDLENSVINGAAAQSNPQGSGTVRRTMRGILAHLQTHRLSPGTGGLPSGSVLTEEMLNAALRAIWQNSAGTIDTIVVGGRQKRQINGFVATNRRFASSAETFRDMINVYESDFGVCRIVLSRWVPSGTVLLLDSSRISVLPLSGRSFHFRPLARTGDRESGQVLGEYTLELRNESAHGVITGLS